MKWECLCRPKAASGLRFKKIHDFNLALLSKQGWKFFTDPSSFVSKLYRARYFPNSSFYLRN